MLASGGPESTSMFHWPMWVTRRVLDGTCRGLVYLHSHGIIHRGNNYLLEVMTHCKTNNTRLTTLYGVDMKSANLLLDDGFNIKVTTTS